MTRLATMGTSSCATLSISGWTSTDKNLEKSYMDDPKGFTPVEPSTRGDVPLKNFGDKILYPLSQPMGESYDYPFSYIMEHLDNGSTSLGAKFIIITLNDNQHNVDDFWVSRLKDRGFELIDQTHNNAGGLNYIYTRNSNRDSAFNTYENYLND